MSILNTNQSRENAAGLAEASADAGETLAAAVAWALIYVGDRIAETSDYRGLEEALNGIGTAVSGIEVDR